jgi:hypothetical protein
LAAANRDRHSVIAARSFRSDFFYGRKGFSNYRGMGLGERILCELGNEFT